jgi:hypothetical protein
MPERRSRGRGPGPAGPSGVRVRRAESTYEAGVDAYSLRLVTYRKLYDQGTLVQAMRPSLAGLAGSSGLSPPTPPTSTASASAEGPG